ncbi:RseA family anti-sigma factor [Stutzerimonas tarimensis]|uniref:RseA family anti-sigma factor n=1 Tax=Stutzerimonas tarimensis TaxID=1507735 RepID=A0ABV7TA58_9GAMM
MSREALHESLSAVMDNEADELELRRVLAAGADADEVDATWSRYQIARAAMHKELIDPRLDIASAVSAAIAADEVPAPAAAPVPARRSGLRGLGRIAVAASVTVAVLAGVRLYNQTDVAGPELAAQPVQPAQPVLSAPQNVQSPAVLAGFSDKSGDAQAQPGSEAARAESWQEQRLPSYLRQHAQQAAFGDAEGATPPAQTTGMDAR